LIEQSEVARLVLRLLKIEPLYTIAIDRTEWQLGKNWVNVLLLSVTRQKSFDTGFLDGVG